MENKSYSDILDSLPREVRKTVLKLRDEVTALDKGVEFKIPTTTGYTIHWFEGTKPEIIDQGDDYLPESEIKKHKAANKKIIQARIDNVLSEIDRIKEQYNIDVNDLVF